MKRFDVITIFPAMLDALLDHGITRRALDEKLFELTAWDPRNFATDAYRRVDDRPYGGGPGMVMMAPVVFDAVEHVEKLDARPTTRILLTPQGRQLNQELANEFAKKDRLLLIAGHYEGFDERISTGLVPIEVSIGDYVLSGGELAAMVLIDAVVRLLPGALGAEDGAADESFADGLIEHPQFTRPREFRGMNVPDVLLSGDHKKIAQWRLEQRKLRTKERRPDLWQARSQDTKP